MEKFLIFDADRSLATIGTPQDIQTLSGFPEVPTSLGLTQIASNLGIDIGQGVKPPTLFQKEVPKIKHPLFPNTEVPSVRYAPTDLAKTEKISGVVIDTISHVFGQDLRILEAARNSKQLEMQDWGKLERMYLTFLEALKHLPTWVIVNCHANYDKDQSTGAFYYAPMLKGVSRDRIREFFDVVVYTKTSSDKKQYMWQTFADNSRMAKDRCSVLEPTMQQDFKTVIERYRAKGYEPKILVIGESGTGKTKALQTLSKL